MSTANVSTQGRVMSPYIQPQEAPSPRLSLPYLFRTSAQLLLTNWLLLLKIGALLFLFSFAQWWILGDTVQLSDEQIDEQVTNLSIYWLILLIEMPFTAAAAVACHRLFLLDSSAASGLRPYAINRRTLRFFAWTALLVLLFGLTMIVLSFFGLILLEALPQLRAVPSQVGWLLALVAFLPAGMLIASWSLLLPAVALEHNHGGLKWASDLARGNVWPLTLAVYLIPGIAMLVFPWVPIWTFTGSDLVIGLLNKLVTVYTLAMLSLSYTHLRQHADHQKALQTEADEPDHGAATAASAQGH